MPAKPAGGSLPETYFKLVKRFPLVRIRDDDHLDAAEAIVDQLLEMELDDGAQQYLDVLTDLVERYEEEHVSIPDASEADVLRELMRSNELSPERLAERVKISKATISAVLKGTRTLSKEQLIALARFFHVAPAAFLPA